MTEIRPVVSPSMAVATDRPVNTGALESRLTRYESQLADWCHCPDGKTPDGKKKIEDLQQKAQAIRKELKQIEATQSRQRNQVAAAASPTPTTQADTRFRPASRVDVYA